MAHMKMLAPPPSDECLFCQRPIEKHRYPMCERDPGYLWLLQNERDRAIEKANEMRRLLKLAEAHEETRVLGLVARLFD